MVYPCGECEIGRQHMKLTGGQMTCESLIREGVDVIFGIPGGAILPLYQTLPKYPQIRHILVRHEQGAAMAADGYARATGKVGVAWATSGPGSTNLITGIACAHTDSIPIVCITGQVSRGAIGTDAFQETDFIGITMPIVKHSYSVRNAADIPKIIREAFYLARNGRPGPVIVDIPKDVQNEVGEFVWPDSTIAYTSYKPVLEGHPSQIQRAAQLISEAKRPVIISGHGVVISGAYEEIQQLAEKAQIPVITTLLGVGGFLEDHPLYVGMPGMHGVAYASIAIDRADLLIAIGMRFDDRVTGRLSTFAPHAKVIHIDIDPAEIGKNIKPTVPIVGDAKRVIQQLIPLIQLKTHPEWFEQIEQLKREHPLYFPEDGEKLYPQYVIQNLLEQTNGQAIIVTGVGQHQMWAAQIYAFREHGLFISSGGQGAMGYEVPAAMGAAVGRPDKSVWTLAGDGGFQMTMSELATMVENNIPVKIALFNNGNLGMVRQWQDIFYNSEYVATWYGHNPDFVRLAEAFGMPGIRVADRSGVGPAIEQAMACNGPVLVDFVVDGMENVYPMIPSGTSSAELIEDPRLKQQGWVRS
jgi:acetolactate synthase-1/2/3 large subunit